MAVGSEGGRREMRASPLPQTPDEAAVRPLAALEGRSALAGRAPSFARRARLDALCATVVAPFGGALFVLARTGDDTPVATGVLAFIVLAGASVAVRPHAVRAAFCPLVGPFYAFVQPAFGVSALLVLQLVTERPRLTAVDLGVLAVLVGVLARPGATVVRLLGKRVPPVRTAYIGRPSSATRLAAALDRTAGDRYRLIGYVANDGSPGEAGPPHWLGRTADLPELIVRDGVELLVLGPEAPRIEVYEELSRFCLHLPVRLAEYPDFCEEAFGHVPMSEIDATWFQHLLHPSFTPSSRFGKRGVDLLVGGALAIAALPVIGILAMLVRRDGGPAFFVQTRIGAQGRTFPLVKLRTMHAGSDPEWAAEQDARVTPLGRFLRRTHLDELPQLLNVVRGDMSLVGPRPEQPGYVTRLERRLPFYDRRHLIKPGITGWAALRCGYARSDAGSAWKLCHDLYYIEHRSVRFDLLILAETAAELVTGRGVTPEQSRSMLELQLGSTAIARLNGTGTAAVFEPALSHEP
jgi:lipopolysaccharide/colanic/teichoic acid biosynthesis glycosyltransferase